MFENLLTFDFSILQQGYVLPAVALLVACLIFLPTLERFDVSPILGYLIAGLLIGPSGLDMLHHSEALETLADLGVVFLLFIIGLNISWAHFREIRPLILRIGLPQIIVTGIAVAVMAALWDHSLALIALLGLSFALSSTAMISQYLLQNDLLKTNRGKLVMAILLAQDLAVPVILIMASALGQSADENWTAIAVALVVKAIIAVGLVIALARYALRPLHHTLHKRTKTPEITVGLTFLAILLSATLTSMAGLSKELGAFLAGLMLADSGFQDRIHRDIRPFQGLLLGLFFITVGMQIDIREVISDIGWLFAAVVGLFLCKAALVTFICRTAGMTWTRGLSTGVLLAQGSEFVFVIIAAAMASGLMPSNVAQFMLLVTALSMLCTPLYIILSEKLEKHSKSKKSA